MCLYPTKIKNKKYQATKKNGGVPPLKPVYFDTISMVSVDCGRCIECRKKKARDWQMRLSEEMRSTDLRGYFVTWTFSDESLKDLREILRKEDESRTWENFEDENQICRIAVRRYLERWRKKHGKSLRHWMITEKGQSNSERVHMHGIVWTNEDKEDITDRWGYGICDIGKKGVGELSAGYLVKYMSKVDEKHKEYKSKVFASAGIGAGYLKRRDSKRHEFKGEDTKKVYTDRTGRKLPLPKYFRDKIWSEEEREFLFKDSMEQEKAWVLGQEIDTSDVYGKVDYENAILRARAYNKRMGYLERKDFDKELYKKRKLEQTSYERKERQEDIEYRKMVENRERRVQRGSS